MAERLTAATIRSEVAAGVEISFVEPVERPTPESWLALLTSRLAVAMDA